MVLVWRITDDSPNSPNFPSAKLSRYTVIMFGSRVETGSGHPGQPGHVLSGSSGSDPVYKISGSDPDSLLDHVHF